MDPSHPPDPVGTSLAVDRTEPTRLGGLAAPADETAARLIVAGHALLDTLPVAIPPGGPGAPERGAGGRALAAAVGLAARWTVTLGWWSEEVAAHAEAVADGVRALEDTDRSAAGTIGSTVPR